MIKQKKSFISESYVNIVAIIIIFFAIIIILFAGFMSNNNSTSVSMEVDNKQTVEEYSKSSVNYASDSETDVNCIIEKTGVLFWAKQKNSIICS